MAEVAAKARATATLRDGDARKYAPETRAAAPDWVVLEKLKDKAYFGGVHVLPGKVFTEMGDLKPGRGCAADYIKSGSVEAYIGLFSGKGRSGLTSERPSHFDPGRGGKATSWGFGFPRWV